MKQFHHVALPLLVLWRGGTQAFSFRQRTTRVSDNHARLSIPKIIRSAAVVTASDSISQTSLEHKNIEEQDSFLQEATRMLLDATSYPPGTLPKEVLSSAFPTMYSWAKTHSVQGAEMVNRILTRLEEEEGASQANHDSSSSFELTSKHYTVVRRKKHDICSSCAAKVDSSHVLLILTYRPYKLGDNRDTPKRRNEPRLF